MNDSELRILSGPQITRRHIEQALLLDRISYDDEYQLQTDTCVGYYQKNPDIYFMAVVPARDQVVGYINFSPVTEAMYQRIRSGAVIDTVITADDVVTYRDGVPCWGYLSSIAVHPDYRDQGLAARLLYQLEAFIARLASERDIYFHAIVADAVSAGGRHLLSESGFQQIRTSAHDTNIMEFVPYAETARPAKYNHDILNAYRKGDCES